MVKVVYENLPTTIGSFVKETDGFYTIVLNARMSYEDQIRHYRHEMQHITRQDFLGDDLQVIETEVHSITEGGGKK